MKGSERTLAFSLSAELDKELDKLDSLQRQVITTCRESSLSNQHYSSSLLYIALAGVGNFACLIPQERAAQQSVKSVVSV